MGLTPIDHSSDGSLPCFAAHAVQEASQVRRPAFDGLFAGIAWDDDRFIEEQR